MVDPRIIKLAKLLVEHSTKVKKGDHVVINASSHSELLVKEVFKRCILKGAYPSVHMIPQGLSYTFFKHANKDQLTRTPDVAMYESKKADVFINMMSPYNSKEFQNVDPQKIALRSKALNPLSKVRMKKRWCGLDYPCNALAQDAGMSYEEYENFLFDACLIDYKKLAKREATLKKIITKGKQVQIIGKNTDLRLGINKMIAIGTQVTHNVPDGEVFTAPEKYKTEGYIEFSYPAIRAGNEVEGIFLEFKKGKVVKAKATRNEKFLKAMINMDKGSCYLGELGIGTNYKINKFTKNLLFDEKIGGTIHLALGMAYPECCIKNKKQQNDSALHWDILKDLRMGGKVIVDGKVIQDSGKFKVKF